MPILIQQNVFTSYPKKLELDLVFPYTIVNIHNSFDYLEELWEEITYTLSTTLLNQKISILEGTTRIDESYTTITYHLIVLSVPPSHDFSFLYDALVERNLPCQFTIETPSFYETQKKDILLKTI